MHFLLKLLYPSLIWNIPSKEKIIYLTFDDGPIPVITPWVINVLRDFNAKATFFCVGANAVKNPDILQSLIDSGHAIGNHSMNHLNGWKTADQKYMEDVKSCHDILNSPLFRPPYGKIKFSQIKKLKKDYRIVMWDVLSRDYSANLNSEYCFQNIMKKTRAGSIVVFHDSIKAEKHLRYLLPKTLKYFSDMGYSFSAIH